MSKRKDEFSKSILFWVLLTFVVLFLTITPFYKGLFNGSQWVFEAPIYKALISSSVALFLIGIYFYKEWSFKDYRDVLSIGIWMIPVSFLISSINAVSFHEAMNSVYIHFIYAVFFIVGIYFARNKHGLTVIVHTIVGSGYLLVIFGLLNWFGNSNYQEAVLGRQLSGVFQYPNTYAALLIGLFISSLLLNGISKRWYVSSIHSIMFIPTLLSIFLTLSRGGWIVLPITFVLFLIFVPLLKQILFLTYFLFTGVFSIYIFERVNTVRTHIVNEGFQKSLSFEGWTTVVLASLALSTIIYFFNRYFGAWVESKVLNLRVLRKSNFILPLIFVVSGIILFYLLIGGSTITDKFPEPIKLRIESLNLGDQSLIYRSSFFTDAIKIIRDYPMLGAGGGAWSYLYPIYQSSDYTSNQAHLFYLQYIIEVGWIGFGVFLVILMCVILLFMKHFSSQVYKEYAYERLVFIIIASALLIHSAIDFDMSFVYIGAVVFLCLGASVSLIKAKEFSLSTKTSAYISKIVPVFLVITSILIFVVSVRITAGNAFYKDAINLSNRGTVEFNEFNSKIEKAISYQKNPTYVVTKVKLNIQAFAQSNDERYINEALHLFEELKAEEPFNRQLIELERLLTTTINNK